MAARGRQRRGRDILWGSLTWAIFGLAQLSAPPDYRAFVAQVSFAVVVFWSLRGGVRWGLAMGGLGGTLELGLFLAGALEFDAAHPAVVVGMGPVVLLVTGGLIGLLVERMRSNLARQRESEERYALAAKGANDGLWDWDLRTDRVHYSERWRDILGYRPEEITDTPEDWLERIHPDDVGNVRSPRPRRRHPPGACRT